MSKFLKITYSLIGLVLLSSLGWVIGTTGDYVSLPYSYRWLSWDIDRLPNFLDPALYYYYFWAAIVMFVLVLIILLAVIFYPRTYTEIQLRNKNGKLLLKKSAIENYVATAIKVAGLMPNPNVNAKLYKRKFKIDVSGQLASRVGVTDQVNGIKEGIETGLKEFFGLDRPVNFKVYVKEIADSDRKRVARKRVE